ncbi:MAG: hypothetical protein ACRDTE_15415 [Pseudonocardiaceae bacterium]
MATTEKISLSLDTGALLLARRAAEIDGLSLSAWMSRLVRRHAWESERPRLPPDELTRSDQRTVAEDDQDLALYDEGRRAAR